MARYIGPKCKLSRREGTDLFLKSGARALDWASVPLVRNPASWYPTRPSPSTVRPSTSLPTK